MIPDSGNRKSIFTPSSRSRPILFHIRKFVRNSKELSAEGSTEKILTRISSM